MQIKVDETGLQGRAVNPYRCTDGFLNTCWEMPEASICDACRKNSDFENAVQSYPLTEKATPNSVVEVDDELVWQFYAPNQLNPTWKETAFQRDWYIEQLKRNGCKVRQSYQVSGVKEDEPKSGIAIKKRIEVPFLKLVKTHTGIWEAYKFIHGKTPYDTNKPSSITQDKWWDYCNHLEHQGFMPLKTLESGSGTQNADFGDYLMKGISGEVYPCKPDIFALTYDII